MGIVVGRVPRDPRAQRRGGDDEIDVEGDQRAAEEERAIAARCSAGPARRSGPRSILLDEALAKRRQQRRVVGEGGVG